MRKTKYAKHTHHHMGKMTRVAEVVSTLPQHMWVWALCPHLTER